MNKPNLDYLVKLCDGNMAAVQKFIVVIKRELKEEIEIYSKAIDDDDLDTAALWAHKIKHKIGILGLDENYSLAQEHESLLRDGDKSRHPAFREILSIVEKFIAEV